MSLTSPLCRASDRPRVGFWRIVAAVALGTFACSGKRAPAPSDPVAPRAYVAQVRNVLAGLAPTDDEVKAVDSDPRAFEELVDSWMKRPEYAKKMMRFFQLAFQQTQVSANDFADQVYGQLGRNPV